MKKIFKWIGIILGLAILTVTMTTVFIVRSFNAKLNKHYDFQVQNIPIPADSISIARGRSWSAVCTSCHGENLGGKIVFEDPGLATIYASNLTSGAGGVASVYSDQDWIRAIRHGVRRDGKALFLMPAHEFHHLNQSDLASLIAYIKTLDPIDQMPKPLITTTVAKILGELGAFGILFPAEIIDHSAEFDSPIDAAVTPKYGEYVVNVVGCRTCHGQELNGGKDPNPDAPPGPNLTPGGIMSKYSGEQFLHTIRTGVTLTGRTLNEEFMPWPAISKLDEIQIRAIYIYLKSLPALETSVQ
jgi:cytochrome c553